MRLPDFALERYFARYEFDLPYLLGSSDIEPYRLAELLALADGECRELWEGLSLGYTESAGHPLLRREIAGSTRRPPRTTCSSSRARRRRSSPT